MKIKLQLFFLVFLNSIMLNAQSWSELGAGANALNPNDAIQAMCSDASGNIYAAGRFTNTNGKYCVAKWNGSSWSELGAGANALNANSDIKSIGSDASGNIYAAGFFTNAENKSYVAKWDGSSWS